MPMTWSLGSIIQYTAGQALQGTISLVSPEEDVSVEGYILGALHDANGDVIVGTAFNVAWSDADVAENVAGIVDPPIWVMPTFGRQIPFRFTFDRSDVTLKVWDLKMEGAEPDPDTDPILSILTTALTTPTPIDPFQEILPSIMMLMVMGMMFSMLGGMTE